jgi:hypothetical protein
MRTQNSGRSAWTMDGIGEQPRVRSTCRFAVTSVSSCHPIRHALQQLCNCTHRKGGPIDYSTAMLFVRMIQPVRTISPGAHHRLPRPSWVIESPNGWHDAPGKRTAYMSFDVAGYLHFGMREACIIIGVKEERGEHPRTDTHKHDPRVCKTGRGGEGEPARSAVLNIRGKGPAFEHRTKIGGLR